MKLTGAEILIECLKEQNVDTIFGFPGGAVLNIYDALYKAKDSIRHILVSHEQGLPTQQMAMQEPQVRWEFAWPHQDRELPI